MIYTIKCYKKFNWTIDTDIGYHGAQRKLVNGIRMEVEGGFEMLYGNPDPSSFSYHSAFTDGCECSILAISYLEKIAWTLLILIIEEESILSS